MDFSSWQSLLVSLVALALFALIGVGIRLVMMMTFQQRRERANRQINERLKTLMAAYKVLGGSFTGDLSVDPRHLRQLRTATPVAPPDGLEPAHPADPGSERARRIRDAVEAALADVILLGTDEQVRLAQRAAVDLVEGRTVRTHDLVVSLRDFVRHALDLAPIPSGLEIPMQGPTRPSAGGGGRTGDRGPSNRGGAGAMGGAAGGGIGMGMGATLAGDEAGRSEPR
jgi:hypothetical protein